MKPQSGAIAKTNSRGKFILKVGENEKLVQKDFMPRMCLVWYKESVVRRIRSNPVLPPWGAHKGWNLKFSRYNSQTMLDIHTEVF